MFRLQCRPPKGTIYVNPLRVATIAYQKVDGEEYTSVEVAGCPEPLIVQDDAEALAERLDHAIRLAHTPPVR